MHRTPNCESRLFNVVESGEMFTMSYGMTSIDVDLDNKIRSNVHALLGRIAWQCKLVTSNFVDYADRNFKIHYNVNLGFDLDVTGVDVACKFELHYIVLNI